MVFCNLFKVCSVIHIPYGLEKNMKDFDLFGIETHSISPNPYILRVKRTVS
jgi:hypothetical protein